MTDTKEIISPDQEGKEVKQEEVVEVKNDKSTEGSVEAEMAKSNPKEDTPKQETVPLHTYLEVKNDLKELKREIKEARTSDKHETALAGVKDIAAKYPDVSEDFIADILSSATSAAQSELDKRVTPMIERQEAEQKQAQFDKAFDKLYDKALKDNPDLPKSIDKNLVKTLALTPQYRNVPLGDILETMYGGTVDGSESSETKARASADRIEDIVNFDKITKDQKDAIMADPKVRQKYFDYLDTK